MPFGLITLAFMKINLTKNRTLLIVGSLALVIIIWMLIGDSIKNSPLNNKTQSEKSLAKPIKKVKINTSEMPEPKEKAANPAINNTPSKYIKGLLPSDVYGNMNMRGFKTERFLESGMGYTWVSKKSRDDFDYEVTAWSEDDDKKVQTVKATAICNPPNEIYTTVEFFQMVSTLPYDNSKPQTAAGWVSDNFYESKATTTIGGVKFTLFSKSEYEKIFLMESAE